MKHFRILILTIAAMALGLLTSHGQPTQTITFPAIPDQTFSIGGSVQLLATASSGLTISYTIVSGPATVSGDILSYIGAGTVVVRASQAGNGTWDAATPVDKSITINKGTAAIVLSGLSRIYDGTPRMITATTTPSGLTVDITYDASPTAPTNAGSYAIVATVDDPNWAGTESDTLIVAKATQTITFPAIPDLPSDRKNIELGATSDSGLDVAYSVKSGPAIFDAGELKLTGEGSVTITASQAGDTNFLPATDVDRTFTALPSKWRILMLGDSITQGAGNFGSYRDPLLRIMLNGENILGVHPFEFIFSNVDFIGTKNPPLDVPNSNFPNSLLLDPDHEGHADWSADDILVGKAGAPAEGKLSDWLDELDYHPNIVLAHIGSNDARDQHDDPAFIADTRAEIGGIIDTLAASNPDVIVLLAKLIPFNYGNDPTFHKILGGITAVNAMIDIIAREKNTVAGKEFVRVIDQNSGFDRKTMLQADLTHPNGSGEDFMAANWFRTLSPIITSGGVLPAQPDPTTTQVLLLGDDVTQGSVLAGGTGVAGYREPLMRLFAGESIGGANPTNQVVAADFIGTMINTAGQNPWIDNYDPALAANPRHEGHAGYTTEYLLNGHPTPSLASGTGKLSEWLEAYPRPDVVFLHAGTMDAWFNDGIAGPSWIPDTRANLKDILVTLRSFNNNVKVFIAKVAKGAAWYETEVDLVNAEIDGLAAEENAAAGLLGPYVFVVDQNTDFDRATMLAGDINVNQAGAEFMAANWFNASFGILTTGSLTPLITSPTTATGTVDDAFTYTIAATTVPSSYGATGLPAGLTVNTATGEITGTPTAAGSFTATVSATNAAGTGTEEVEITVGKATATVTLENLEQVYDGLQKSATATTTPTGLTVELAYDGSATAPADTGSYEVVATINDDDYEGTAAGTLVISKGAATVTLAGLEVTYDGIEKAVTATTAPAGLTVALTYDGGVAGPIDAGSYAVVGTIDDANWEGSASGTLVIAKADQIITFLPLPDVTFGIDSITLMATASSGLPVTLGVLGGPAQLAGNVLSLTGAGTVSLEASQGGNENYNAATAATQSFGVSKASATVTLADLTHVYDGTAKSATVTTDPAGLPVVITYDGGEEAPSDIGTYVVMAIIEDNGYSGSATATLEIALDTQFVNLSSRAMVGIGADIVIPGFVVSGTGTKKLLIRGIGPELAQFGVEGVLENPTLALFKSGANEPIASNTGWSTNSNAAEIATVTATRGAFPLQEGSADCAILVTLEAGAYTVQLKGVDETVGIGLVEIYCADENPSIARLSNISTRSQVGTGDNLLIPGYVIEGDEPRLLLIRGIGPGLEQFGLSGLLQNPTITVFQDGDPVATNDDWGINENVSEIILASTAIGAFELDEGSKDAVVLIVLDPETYTVQLSGVGGTTGLGLIEIYEVVQ